MVEFLYFAVILIVINKQDQTVHNLTEMLSVIAICYYLFHGINFYGLQSINHSQRNFLLYEAWKSNTQ